MPKPKTARKENLRMISLINKTCLIKYIPNAKILQCEQPVFKSTVSTVRIRELNNTINNSDLSDI